jgi:hypothetical protein
MMAGRVKGFAPWSQDKAKTRQRLASEFVGVPKRDLITAGLIALQDGRLKIPTSDALPETAQLTEELLNYRVRINLRGHDSFEPWREGDHDDLLFALCLSCWAWRFTRSSAAEQVIAPARSAP